MNQWADQSQILRRLETEICFNPLNVFPRMIKLALCGFVHNINQSYD